MQNNKHNQLRPRVKITNPVFRRAFALFEMMYLESKQALDTGKAIPIRAYSGLARDCQALALYHYMFGSPIEEVRSFLHEAAQYVESSKFF